MSTKLLIVIICCGLAMSTYSQTNITGKVQDESSGKGLPGATILISKTNLGTVTDEDGNFELQIPDGTSKTLRVSYVGYVTQQIEIGESKDLIIKMASARLLEEVVVEGVRAEESDPISQTTLDLEEIESVQVGQSPALILEELTPSIVAYSESGSGFGNYTLFRLRGIDQSRINITLNGVPLNDLIDQGTFFSNFTDFGNSVESVQVQRGVGTSTTGAASYAGSINFESIQLDDSIPSFDLQFLAGSFNSYKVSGELKTGILKNNFAFYSRFTQAFTDGFKFNSGARSRSFFFSGGYFGKNDIFKVTAFSGASQREIASVPVPIDLIQLEPRTNIVSPNDEDDFTQEFIQLQHSHWFTNRLAITSSAYYNAAGGSFPFGFEDGNRNAVEQNFVLFNDHFGALSNVNYESASGDFDITGGIHGYTFRRINEENISPNFSAPFYSDRSQKDEFSTFAKATYRFGKLSLFGDIQVRAAWLTFTPDREFLTTSGVDLSNLSNAFTRQFTFVNPKGGVSLEVSNQLSFYASFGRSGREPTRTDILGSTIIGAGNLDAVIDDNSVRPEFVNDLEIGGSIRRDNLNIKANFFFARFQDEIAPIGVFEPAGFIQFRENIDRSTRTGVEVEWQWQPVTFLEFTGNGTYQSSEVEQFSFGGSDDVFEDVDPILTPEFQFTGKLTYHYKNWLDLSFSGRYVDDSFLELTNDEDFTLPSFFKADLGLTLRWKRHSFTFTVDNLFDEEFFTFGTPADVDFDGVNDSPAFLIQPPRSYFGVFRFKF